MNKDTLVIRSLAGDVDAFNQLVLEYQNLAYQVAYYLLFNQEAATEVVQYSFVRACRTLDSFQPGSFRNWLIRIVTNTCCDLLRKQQCELTSRSETFPMGECHREPHAGALQSAESTEAIQYLRAGIQQLPSEQRVALVLNDRHGFTYAESAEIRGIAMGTVKSHVSSARVHLRDCFVQGRCPP